MVRIVDMTSQPMSRISAMAMLGRATLSFLLFSFRFGAPLLDMEEGNDVEAYDTRDANCYYQEPSVVRHALNEHTLLQIINNDACVAGLVAGNGWSGSWGVLGHDCVERVGGAIANNRYLQSLYIGNDIYDRSRNIRSLVPLFRGLARNRSITHLRLSSLDLSQADTISIITTSMSSFLFGSWHDISPTRNCCSCVAVIGHGWMCLQQRV